MIYKMEKDYGLCMAQTELARYKDTLPTEETLIACELLGAIKRINLEDETDLFTAQSIIRRLVDLVTEHMIGSGVAEVLDYIVTGRLMLVPGPGKKEVEP